MSTLGLVEFFIWVLLTYWESINISKEKIFVKVHFTLFYTAILNAFQTVIIAIVTTRVSDRIWVQTESLELNHYVEIREEFERVQQEIDRIMGDHHSSKDSEASSSTSVDEENPTKKKDTSLWVSERIGNPVARTYRSLRLNLLFPGLQSRYNALLLQVRFHELRVHFLKAYNLPLKFKVSDYLIRAEQHVLIRLVHVSTVAWLLLTASINLLYYLMGIITWETERPDLVGKVLTYIFFLSMTIFIFVAILLFNKMQTIFSAIMHKRVLWDTEGDEESKIQLARQQRSLFWGGDPTLVIAAIQFMQFGYAVALAVCLIFWETINNGDVVMVAYILSIFACYAIFVLVAAQIIPRYTLCTSLGQLVDRKRLNEALACFQLEETRKRRLWEVETQRLVLDGSIREAATGQRSSGTSTPTTHLGTTSGARTPIRSTSNGSLEKLGNGVDPAALMAEMVKLDTTALRDSLPTVERDRLAEREKRRKARKRWKTVSDGVAAMATMSSSQRELGERRSVDDSDLRLPKAAMDTSSAASGSVQEEPLTAADTNADRLAARKARRSNRKKSMSDGVAMMAALSRSHREEEEKAEEGVPDHARIPLVVESRSSDTAPSLHPICEIGSPTLDENEDTKAEESAVHDSDDDHSDADDVPEVDPSMIVRPHTEKEVLSWKQRLISYYMSKRFVVTSNVLGTMVAFFFVGQRVERFLHTDGVVTPNFVSFDFHEAISFWVLMALFLLFIGGDALILYLLYPHRRVWNKKEIKVVTSAIIDILIVSTCLALFVAAEVERCCEPLPDLARWLAEEDVEGKEQKVYDLQPAPCTCTVFGTRLYGGLGSLEPYISIIALRLFRHWFAKRLMALFDYDMDEAGRHHTVRSPFDIYGDGDHGHGGHDHHSGSDRGTAVELWESAVASHPEIVSAHGEFSAEILQVMLGLPVLVPHGKGSPMGDKDSSVHVVPQPATQTLGAPPAGRSFELSRQYSTLTPHAQEIIMAGKLGHSVKSYSVANLGSLLNQPAIPENASTELQTEQLRFQIDTTPSPPALDDEILMFQAPEARLVRSLRRCDRKLLPFLTTWTVVDVAITRQEMVYFDASDVDGVAGNDDLEDTRSALAATKGGKGLRLCDVAKGRKIVGHLSLVDVKAVHVERDLPAEADSEEYEGDEGVGKNEYWCLLEGEHSQRRLRAWKRTKQDSLKIETTHGHTLFLRFYSDLENNEHHVERMMEEDEVAGDLFKNNAFQWAQTIGRFCGPEQLQQPLEHFGDDTPDELRDYLVVHDADYELRSKGARELLRRAMTKPRLTTRANSTGDETDSGMRRNKSFLFRGQSFGETLEGEGGSTKRQGSLFRRSASMVDFQQTATQKFRRSSSIEENVTTGHRRSATTTDIADKRVSFSDSEVVDNKVADTSEKRPFSDSEISKTAILENVREESDNDDYFHGV